MSSVDVVIPCYRYGHFLEECVQSVLMQSGVDLRVLIIDDASPDNTAEVCQQLSTQDVRVTFTRHTVNKGHIPTYNEGIEWTSGDYMLLLSADDFLLPGALRRATEILDLHPEAGFVFGSYDELRCSSSYPSRATIVPHVSFGRHAFRILSGLEFIRISGSRCIVATPTAVVRTAIQKRVGGYREQFPHAGDMEMWLRLAAHGAVGVVRSQQAVWRCHLDNMSHAYYAESRRPDLLQKMAVIEHFMKEFSHRLSDPNSLYHNMMRSLSLEAVGRASAAYNEENRQLSTELSELALSIDPRVKYSWPWFKFSLKRLIGLRAFRAIEPTLAELRRRLYAGRRS